MNSEKKEIEFESALKKLETIVENLENGELSLDAALKQYEEGVKMADICSKRLNDAQKKVEVLMKTSGGKLKAAPYEESPDESSSRSKKKK
jgi:exodeoxyribonuclease VII small subunit